MDNSETMTFKESGDWRLSKLKDYGKEAYRPFMELLLKYQDAFIPYLRSLSRGLYRGGEGPSVETAEYPEADRFISGLFNEAAKGVDELLRVLEAKDKEAFSSFLKNMSDKKPSLAFSTSYVAGLFIGRLTRHIISENRVVKGGTTDTHRPQEGHIH
jgi:hypothetical protein